MRLFYTLTNLDPLVLSQTSATTNNHLGLDYIPGSAILGALATRFYTQGNSELGFELFQSGACQFGPAYPLYQHEDTDKTEVALPIPSAWHTEKHNDTILHNHIASDFLRDDNIQYTQCRSGFIAHNNQAVNLKKGLTTRTALDDSGQRAADGQLFTYTTLLPNQQFGGWIQATTEEQLTLLKELLTQELFLGRSRSSEFGRVRIAIPKQQPTLSTPQNLGDKLVIWCLNDVALLDHHGQPTLAPNASHIHPELEGELIPHATFIRHHKVRRFNRARGGFDTEQQLITRGSVLSFQLNAAVSQAVLKQIAHEGIGIQRQHGLGWVAVNPIWTEQTQPEQQALFEPLYLEPPVTKAATRAEHSPLIKWVQQKEQTHIAEQEQQSFAYEKAQEIQQAYATARSYNNIAQSHQAGPSRSQWQRLNELIKSQPENWNQHAFEGEAAICKAKNDELGWGLSWQSESKQINFSEFANELLAATTPANIRRLLEIICRFDLSTLAGLQALEQHLNATSQHKGEA